MQEKAIHAQGDDDGRFDGGVPLPVYQGPIDPAMSDDPLFANLGGVDPLARLSEDAAEYVRAHLEGGSAPEDVIHDLPLAYWQTRTPSEYWMMRIAATYGFHHHQENHLERDPRLFLMGKIQSSHWRNGLHHAEWSEIVEAYKGIASFDLGLEGFEVRVDHTTDKRFRGYAFHELIHLDGALAFHLHHKGRRVMTIGFSFADGNRILIQQVQIASKRGNRWLFRFPSNRIEFVVERFSACFPRHSIHLVDGFDLCDSIADIYLENLQRSEKYAECLHPDHAEKKRARESVELNRSKIRVFREDRERIQSLYEDTGRFERGEAYVSRDIRHYRMIDARAA